MAIAIGTALAIGTIAAKAGTAVVGAKMASNAAKGAARDQVAASDRAKRSLSDSMAPWHGGGQGAPGTLGPLARLTTPSAGARYAVPSGPGGGPPRGPQRPPPSRPRPGMIGPGQDMGQMRGGPPGTLGGMAQGGPPQQQGPPQMGGGGQMVMIEAPDGSGARPVPASQAEQLIAAGGRRVG